MLGLFDGSVVAQADASKDQAIEPQPAAPAPQEPPARTTSRYRPGMPARARNYYQSNWGVDSFTVRSVESGEMIRFSYKVIDAEKATQLNDKHNEPSLLDEQANVRLVVPTLEKVGQLRQSSTPEAGKIYWMVFSNKGGHVKRGHRVSVVIGKFRVDNLLVE